MIKFHIESSKFNGDDINTKFQPRSQIAPDYITAIIDKTMQSHNTVDMSDDFEINVIHVRIPTGSGLRRMLDPNMVMNLVRRRIAITGMRWESRSTDTLFCLCLSHCAKVKNRILQKCEKMVTMSKQSEKRSFTITQKC